MAVESPLAFSDGPEYPGAFDGVQKSGRGLRHVPLAEASTTVWSRDNPDVLIKPDSKQKTPPAEKAQPDSRERNRRAHDAIHAPSATAFQAEQGAGQKRADAAPQKPPRLEPLADFLKQYPQLPSEWRNNFWEATGNQNQKTAEHEALPSMESVEVPPEKIARFPQDEEIIIASGTGRERAAAEKLEAAAPEAELKPAPETVPNSAGDRLKQLNQMKAQRAAELSRKNGETAESPERSPEAAPEQMNFSISSAELLALAEHISADGVSMAEMFRAGRLDESGLRRVMSEYLRGRSFEKVLTEEILRNAMKYERDPQLRAVKMQHTGSGSAKRVAANAKNRAKKALNPQTNRERASKLAGRLVTQFDRAVDSAEAHPNTARTFFVAAGVVVYLLILILIIKS